MSLLLLALACAPKDEANTDDSSPLSEDVSVEVSQFLSNGMPTDTDIPDADDVASISGLYRTSADDEFGIQIDNIIENHQIRLVWGEDTWFADTETTDWLGESSFARIVSLSGYLHPITTDLVLPIDLVGQELTSIDLQFTAISNGDVDYSDAVFYTEYSLFNNNSETRDQSQQAFLEDVQVRLPLQTSPDTCDSETGGVTLTDDDNDGVIDQHIVIALDISPSGLFSGVVGIDEDLNAALINENLISGAAFCAYVIES